ncbi:MAG: hypothetical protein HYV07_33425 [Deltaproteobacteria bacterium]|nr:hypothetical protein [Deltaproteobacteria bacterium]
MLRAPWILVALVSSSCAARRLVVPYAPGTLVSEASLPDGRAPRIRPEAGFEDVDLTLTDIVVIGQSSADRDRDRALVADALAEYLRSTARFARVSHRRPAANAPIVPVSVRATIRLDTHRNRTWVLDAFSAYPFLGLFPLTPEWGETSVAVRLEASVDEPPAEPGASWVHRVPIPPIDVEVRSDFSEIVYSWYRTGPEEDAFRRAYSRAFADASVRLFDALRDPVERSRAPLLALRESRPGASPPPATERRCVPRRPEYVTITGKGAFMVPHLVYTRCEEPRTLTATVAAPELPTLSTELTASSTMGPTWPGPVALPGPGDGAPVTEIAEEGLRVITRPVQRERETLIERYLAALGGVEVSAFAGLASVSTQINTPTHPNEVVGSGRATSSGYRVSLFRPPDRTGFFFPATLGFLSEEVRIEGFMEELPLANTNGAQTIGARVTDPATGQEDFEAINYNLRLKSGFLTQSVTLNLVIGTDDVQMFATGRVGVNLFEIRHLDVEFFEGSESVTDLRAFLSGSAGAQLGLSVPALHAALRAAFDFEWYNEFEYPNRIDFLASPTFDAERDVFVRERAWAEAVSLIAWNAQVSGVVTF